MNANVNKLNLLPYYNIPSTTKDGYRVYKTPKGKEYPSVTTILSKIPHPELDEWFKRVGEEEARLISNQSSGAGKELHKRCEDYFFNREFDSTTYGVRVLFGKIKPYLNKIDNIRGVEIPLYSDYLKLAGTSDVVGNYKNIPSIIDFKNSRQPKRKEWITNYFLQGAAYSRMIWDMYKIHIKKIVIIIAVWDGSVQVFEEPVVDWVEELENVMNLYNPLWE